MLPVMARLLRRAQFSSWLSWRCSLVLVAAVAAGDRSGLLNFLKRRGGGAANSFYEKKNKGKRTILDIIFKLYYELDASGDLVGLTSPTFPPVKCVVF